MTTFALIFVDDFNAQSALSLFSVIMIFIDFFFIEMHDVYTYIMVLLNDKCQTEQSATGIIH